MPKVLISDKMDPKAAQIFRERGVEVDEITGKTPEELKAIIGQYDGLAIRSSTKVTKDILDAATNLKVVGRAGIGVDNVDIPAASAKGVVRSEEHTSELQSLMRISYAVFCLKKKTTTTKRDHMSHQYKTKLSNGNKN